MGLIPSMGDWTFHEGTGPLIKGQQQRTDRRVPFRLGTRPCEPSGLISRSYVVGMTCRPFRLLLVQTHVFASGHNATFSTVMEME